MLAQIEQLASITNRFRNHFASFPEVIVRGDSFAVEVYYQNAKVMTLYPGGEIILDSGGYQTRGNLLVLNQCLVLLRKPRLYEADDTWYFQGSQQQWHRNYRLTTTVME